MHFRRDHQIIGAEMSVEDDYVRINMGHVIFDLQFNAVQLKTCFLNGKHEAVGVLLINKMSVYYILKRIVVRKLGFVFN